MPSPGETAAPRRPSIFLSYPSEDRAAARALRDALSANGLEVWYDEEELTGGDAWDQKIRRQIRECDYFMPLISAYSEARREGYFRREWRLAVERTLDMADDHLFLLPVVTDGTEQSGARVPERFFTVQWLRVAGGMPTPALAALCQRLVTGETEIAVNPPRRVPPPLKPPAVVAATATPLVPPPPSSPVIPPFPNQEPGQPVKFWAHVLMWLGRAGWIQFNRLPRVIRILIYCYLCYLLVTNHGGKPRRAEPPGDSPAASAATAKVAAIAHRYEAGEHKGDAVKLGEDIAREVAAELGDKPSVHAPLLVFPFSGRGGTPEDEKFASSTFAMLFAKLSIARPGKVGVQPPKLAPGETAQALVAASEHHARFLILGGVVTSPPGTGPTAPGAAVGPSVIPAQAAKSLQIRIVNVKTGTPVWSQDYPVAGLDPDKLTADVEKNLPDLDEEDDDN